MVYTFKLFGVNIVFFMCFLQFMEVISFSEIKKVEWSLDNTPHAFNKVIFIKYVPRYCDKFCNIRTRGATGVRH